MDTTKTFQEVYEELENKAKNLTEACQKLEADLEFISDSLSQAEALINESAQMVNKFDPITESEQREKAIDDLTTYQALYKDYHEDLKAITSKISETEIATAEAVSDRDFVGEFIKNITDFNRLKNSLNADSSSNHIEIMETLKKQINSKFQKMFSTQELLINDDTLPMTLSSFLNSEKHDKALLSDQDCEKEYHAYLNDFYENKYRLYKESVMRIINAIKHDYDDTQFNEEDFIKWEKPDNLDKVPNNGDEIPEIALFPFKVLKPDEQKTPETTKPTPKFFTSGIDDPMTKSNNITPLNTGINNNDTLKKDEEENSIKTRAFKFIKKASGKTKEFINNYKKALFVAALVATVALATGGKDKNKNVTSSKITIENQLSNNDSYIDVDDKITEETSIPVITVNTEDEMLEAYDDKYSPNDLYSQLETTNEAEVKVLAEKISNNPLLMEELEKRIKDEVNNNESTINKIVIGDTFTIDPDTRIYNDEYVNGEGLRPLYGSDVERTIRFIGVSTKDGYVKMCSSNEQVEQEISKGGTITSVYSPIDGFYKADSIKIIAKEEGRSL